jgi:hypothetical protein
MRVLIVSAFLASGIAFGAPSPEAAAVKYADAIARQDWRAAVSSFRASDMTRLRSAVAKQIEKTGEGIRKELFGSLSAAEISKLSDAEFCEKVFSASSAMLEQEGLDFETREGSFILGVVPDSENVVYVVIKHKGTVKGHATESVDLWPVIRDEGNWFVGIPKLFETAMWADR